MLTHTGHNLEQWKYEDIGSSKRAKGLCPTVLLAVVSVNGGIGTIKVDIFTPRESTVLIVWMRLHLAP